MSERLRITDVVRVPLREQGVVGEIEPAWSPGSVNRVLRGGGAYLEIRTDAGITGIGPDVAPEVVAAAMPHLLGADPFTTEHLSDRLRYHAAGTSYRGRAGIDIALWDLVGKVCGQPLARLWGGNRERVPVYASLIRLSEPDERAAQAAGLRAAGFGAVKVRIHHPTLAEDVATVARVRDAVGAEMAIMVDANQAQSSGDWQPGVRWDYRRAAATARELERLDCYWLEEPLPRYAFADLARLTAAVDLPIAGGENNPAVHEFRTMLTERVYDILQPEGMVVGGPTEMRKIATLAAAFGRRVVPHHGGSALGIIAHLHLVASWPHAPYLELLHDPPVGDYRHLFAALAEPPEVTADGCMAVPTAPGLGVSIDPEAVA
jgi:L-alanine-DL-glutamate epimerase-like enolase superfamily enzyme